MVGGEAVIYYGYARLTGDVDFYYESSKENALRLFEALNEFWAGDIPGIKSAEELIEPGIILQFGLPPNRIDLINHIDGVIFHEVWINRVPTDLEIAGRHVPVNFIGLKELIKNKQAINRPKDLEDLKYLMKVKENNS